MKNRKYTKKIVVGVILIILILLFRNFILQPLNNLLYYVNYRLVNTKTLVYKEYKDYKNRLNFLEELDAKIQENKKLKEENLKLKAEKINYDEIVNENKELRESLKLSVKNTREYILADVILIESLQNDDIVYINKGSDDGVEENLLILLDNNIIGKVNKVNKKYSEVYLISNPNIKMSVKVNDNVLAILRGVGNSEFVINNFNVEAVEKIRIFNIKTSGISKYYPKGLSIGNYVIQDENKLIENKDLVFKLKFDISSLNTVVIYKYDKSKLNLINEIENKDNL